jgi:hypothetical protein
MNGKRGKTMKKQKQTKKKVGDNVKGFFEAGECLMAEKPKAASLTEKVPGLKGEKKSKKPGVMKKKSIAPCLLNKDDPQSWWNTPAGIKRRILMIEGMLSGKYNGMKTKDKEKIANAREQIAGLKAQLKEA